MIDAGYPWGDAFQLRLLAFLLKDPEKVLGVIEPEFFTDPITVDIAKVIGDIHKKHKGGEGSISKATLKESVRAGLGKKEEHWSAYRKVIRQVYKTKLTDKNVLFDHVMEFARETRYRDALVKAERDINAKKYDGVKKRIEDVEVWLSTRTNGQSRAAATVELPTFYLHQLLGTEFDTDQEYLVETIVPRGGAILSFGLPKGLKSWFSTAMALDAAIGDGKALGYFNTRRPVKVLLVQVEDPARRTKERLQRLREARPFHQNPYPGNLTIIPRCPLNLLDPKWMAELERVIEKEGSELVIFDVFRRLFRGNVNSPEDTAAFLEAVDRLRDKYGVAAWIVHHSNKKSLTTHSGILQIRLVLSRISSVTRGANSIPKPASITTAPGTMTRSPGAS